MKSYFEHLNLSKVIHHLVTFIDKNIRRIILISLREEVGLFTGVVEAVPAIVRPTMQIGSIYNWILILLLCRET